MIHKPKLLPRKLISGNNIAVLTNEGSYLFRDKDGVIQQRNPTAYEDLIILGYKPEQQD